MQLQTSADMALRAYTIRILSFTASAHGPACSIDAIHHAFPPSLGWLPAGLDEHQVVLDVRHSDTADEAWHVVEDASDTYGFRNLHQLQSFLVWLINSRAVDRIGRDHLLVHAGTIAAGDAGIILPAQSGSGKSTLTAALVADGFSYFSDEVAVIDRGTGMLLPFPKAIKLEPDCVAVLASRYPELARASADPERDRSRQTYLRPPDDAWPDGPAEFRHIVFPRYIAGARTQLTAISRSDAFERLLAHSFSAREHAAGGIRDIVGSLQRCEAYELTVGNLDDAVAAIRQLVDPTALSASTAS